ncbi:hypothetical protein BRE01_19930 [Brevibacillus reuszeri]|uniref:Uncharacterized protein n=1 Tax=Brevibacillus reuszeri TaxID=54915 RepID=A0A0K9YXF7_9BACL|nr:hypothetical protein [Brevibacillus reuszeri]KNB73336.1 hypothetical protein ADS79_05080 [Brevibacillus reuszeri]MED1856957.1 hypothetical protein [Brevibacillus reuszeri]GED68291.1 hypothetical protein BRE01_19930 [Brevibacillus reuszeri]
MTYNNNNIMQSQQPHISGAMGAGAMFQPGYAGTNVHEVQHWNHGGHPQSIGTPAPTYGMSYGGGMGGAQSIFSPGFAGTNTQEVRHLNAGYSAQQQQHGGYGQNQALGYMQNQTSYMQAQPSYQQTSYGAQAGSVFSPGFAGTNVHEVQARNNSGYTNYTGQTGYTNQVGNTAGGGIFSPGFAGTNVQEVRHLNQGGYAPTSIMSSGYQGQAQQQQYQNQLGMGAQSMYSPNFAGTNVQEVRQLNAPGQMGQQTTGSIFPGTF